MFDSPEYKHLVDTIEANKTSTASKEERDQAFWSAAVGAFDADIAGDVVLADGRTVNIPTIHKQ